MGGILSKIEALDDFGPEDQSPSARDVAPSRAQGDNAPSRALDGKAPSRALEDATSSPPASNKDELGELMPPIEVRPTRKPLKPQPPTARKPSPPKPRPAASSPRSAPIATRAEKPVRGPRANISIERPEPKSEPKLDLDGAAEALRAPTKSEVQKAPPPPKSKPAEKAAAPKASDDKKEKRLPPRLRKKMEQKTKKETEPDTAQKATANKQVQPSAKQEQRSSAPVEGAQQKGPARPQQLTEARISAPPPIPRAPGEEAPRQAAPQPMAA